LNAIFTEKVISSPAVKESAAPCKKSGGKAVKYKGGVNLV